MLTAIVCYIRHFKKYGMKIKLRILPLLYLTIISCGAQSKEPHDFIPKGYIEFEKHFGDLNKDGQDDCVIIIKKTDKSNIVINRFDKKVDRNRRGIIVLIKNEKWLSTYR